MILTAQEVLKRIVARLDRSLHRRLEDVEVAPLTLDDDQESFNTCLNLLSTLEQCDLAYLNNEMSDVFPAFAHSVLNVLGLFHEIIDSTRFKPAVVVGANLFYTYYQHGNGHDDLAYKLVEELREFPMPYQPNWLNEDQARFQTREFSQFSVETLTHMAQHSLKFQQGMTNNDPAHRTVVLGAGAETLASYECHTNPFLSALVCSTVRIPSPNTSTAPTITSSEVSDLTVQLMRLEGLNLNVPCVGVDYLLVGELIGCFHQAYKATDNPVDQERYAKACTILVDLVVVKLDEPKKNGAYLFRQKADGVSRIDEKAFTTLLRGFERTTADPMLASPFKEAMERYRRVVVGSALNQQAAFAKHPMSIMVAENVISRMFANLKDDLRDPAFLKFIGKSGRLNAAARLLSFNDPEFFKEFLKTNKELRGAALQNELGL